MRSARVANSAKVALTPTPARATEAIGPRSPGPRSPGLVVFDIGEALILARRAFERAVRAGSPEHHLLDLPRELEILVGDALGGMVLEPHLDPGIRGGDVRVVPRGFGEMADRIDHH